MLTNRCNNLWNGSASCSAFVPAESTDRRHQNAASDTTRLLGVTFDRCLNFNCHVQNVVKSRIYHIAGLRHIRPVLDLEVAKRIACSLIGSRFDQTITATPYSTARRPATSLSYMSPLQLSARHLLRQRSVNRRRYVATPAALGTVRVIYRVQEGVTVQQGVSCGSTKLLGLNADAGPTHMAAALQRSRSNSPCHHTSTSLPDDSRDSAP
jgi:hypothetical protein